MNLVCSDPAVSDLGAIRDYTAYDSDHDAVQFVARIIDDAERLVIFPELAKYLAPGPSWRAGQKCLASEAIMAESSENVMFRQATHS